MKIYIITFKLFIGGSNKYNQEKFEFRRQFYESREELIKHAERLIKDDFYYDDIDLFGIDLADSESPKIKKLDLEELKNSF